MKIQLILKVMQKVLKNKKISTLLIYIIIFFLCAYFINTFGIEKIKETLISESPLAPVGIFFLRSLSIIIPALPSTAYSLLAGALLGFKKGLLLICLADLFSCICSYTLSRYYGRPLVRKLVGDKFISKVERISNKHLENNIFLMTGFLMTGLFDFVCYGIGLSRAPLIKFIPALLISIGLSNPPIVALGAGTLDGGKKFLIIAIIGIFLLSLITKKLTQKKLSS